MHFYLAQYRGTGTDADPFTPNGSEVPGWSAIDLRPDPTQQAGRCLLALPERLDAAGRVYLGDSPDDQLPAAVKTALESRLGITFDGNEDRLRRVIPALLVKYAGGARWKPLQAGHDRRLRVHLGGLFWEQAVPAGGSTFSDDFNRANSTSLGSGWNERNGDFEISSNQLLHVGVGGGSRSDVQATAVFGNNQYAAADLIAVSNDGLGVACRMSTVAETYYALYRASATNLQYRKFVSGSFTGLGNNTVTEPALPYRLRLEVSGTSLTGIYAGTTLGSVTDTSIAGGLTGLVARVANNQRFDNFEGGDLVAAATHRFFSMF